MDLIKIGLVGAIGYVAYEFFFGQPAAEVVATGGSSSVAPTGVIATPVVSSSPVAPTKLTAIIPTLGPNLNAEVSNNARLTVSQWNWYVRKDNPTNPIVVGAGDGGRVVTYQEYLGYLFDPSSSLGAIINNVRPIDKIQMSSGDDEFLASLGEGLGRLFA